MYSPIQLIISMVLTTILLLSTVKSEADNIEIPPNNFINLEFEQKDHNHNILLQLIPGFFLKSYDLEDKDWVGYLNIALCVLSNYSEIKKHYEYFSKFEVSIDSEKLTNLNYMVGNCNRGSEFTLGIKYLRKYCNIFNNKLPATQYTIGFSYKNYPRLNIVKVLVGDLIVSYVDSDLSYVYDPNNSNLYYSLTKGLSFNGRLGIIGNIIAGNKFDLYFSANTVFKKIIRDGHIVADYKPCIELDSSNLGYDFGLFINSNHGNLQFEYENLEPKKISLIYTRGPVRFFVKQLRYNNSNSKDYVSGLEYAIYFPDIKKLTKTVNLKSKNINRKEGYSSFEDTAGIRAITSNEFSFAPVHMYRKIEKDLNRNDNKEPFIFLSEETKFKSDLEKEFTKLASLANFGKLRLVSDTGEYGNDGITNQRSVKLEWKKLNSAKGFFVYIKFSNGSIKKYDFPSNELSNTSLIIQEVELLNPKDKTKNDHFEVIVAAYDKNKKAIRVTNTINIEYLGPFSIDHRQIIKPKLIGVGLVEKNKEHSEYYDTAGIGTYEEESYYSIDYKIYEVRVNVNTPASYPLYELDPMQIKFKDDKLESHKTARYQPYEVELIDYKYCCQQKQLIFQFKENIKDEESNWFNFLKQGYLLFTSNLLQINYTIHKGSGAPSIKDIAGNQWNNFNISFHTHPILPPYLKQRAKEEKKDFYDEEGNLIKLEIRN